MASRMRIRLARGDSRAGQSQVAVAASGRCESSPQENTNTIPNTAPTHRSMRDLGTVIDLRGNDGSRCWHQANDRRLDLDWSYSVVVKTAPPTRICATYKPRFLESDIDQSSRGIGATAGDKLRPLWTIDTCKSVAIVDSANGWQRFNIVPNDNSPSQRGLTRRAVTSCGIRIARRVRARKYDSHTKGSTCGEYQKVFDSAHAILRVE